MSATSARWAEDGVTTTVPTRPSSADQVGPGAEAADDTVTEPSSPTYVVVTPVRNEAEHIGRTIEAMAAQTVRPARWVVVDDGSSDDTAANVAAAARDHDWIELVQRADRGHRSAGTGVMQAFADGLARLDDIPWSFLVKLDGDLSFDADYFARCLARFQGDESLGIAGGKLYDVDGDRITHDPHPAFHVRGATKIYRRRCWEQIGGLIEAPGWDTLDEVKANHLGWTTRTLDDVPIYQLRPTGRAAGTWANWVKNGVACYRSGYHPLFVLARAARRTVRPFSLVAPAGLLWGYLRSWATRLEQVGDAELRAYVRQQQWRRLTGRESIWR